MQRCIFCQIVAGKSPCYKVYEDENFFAFLDIYPASAGHTLVIPKKHYQWAYEVPQFTQYWLVVLKVTKSIQKALKPIFISYLTYGLDVAHAHIHVVPRYETISGIMPRQSTMNSNKMKELARKIRDNFYHDRD